MNRRLHAGFLQKNIPFKGGFLKEELLLIVPQNEPVLWMIPNLCEFNLLNF
jgi:hypothetical protein